MRYTSRIAIVLISGLCGVLSIEHVEIQAASRQAHVVRDSNTCTDMNNTISTRVVILYTV